MSRRNRNRAVRNASLPPQVQSKLAEMAVPTARKPRVRTVTASPGGRGAGGPPGTADGPSGSGPPGTPGSPPIRENTPSTQQTSIPAGTRDTTGDPVDVATGEVVLTQTDVRLAGVLPLVLSRTHVSSYRVGRWFGASWASTLDQRLEVDTDGVCYAAPDGMLLFYPVPVAGDGPVFPTHGPRLPLAATDHGYTVTDPVLGHTSHFTRSGTETRPGVRVWPLTATTDRGGNRIELTYDHAETLTAIHHSGGYHLAVDTARGRITGLRLVDSDHPDGSGHPLARYGYDELGRLSEVRPASGEPLVFDYDQAGRLIGWQDRIGGWYRYEYDRDGRCVRTTGAGRMLECRLSYGSATRTTTVTDSLGHASQYICNERGQVVRHIDQLGRETTFVRDPYHRLLAHTDPLGRTTSYTYDPDGNLVQIIYADGTTVTTTYHPRLRLPVSVTGPDGAVRRFSYDDQGNLTSVTDATGAVTRYRYRRYGHLAEVVDPAGGRTRITTDAAGLPLLVTDPDGAVTRYHRDAAGRVVTVTDPVAGTTRLDWTPDGHLARRTAPDGSTEHWQYDSEGNLTGYTDAAGHTTRFEIGPFALVTARTGPDGHRLAFDYDTELRLVAVTDPQGLVWHYRYDPAGQLVSETDFDGHTQTYRYDQAGQLRTRITPGGATESLTRDARGRVIRQQVGDEVTTFAYDPAGRLVRAVNPDAELTFTYDPAGRVLTETCAGRTVTSWYDPLGRRVRRRTPSGGESRWAYGHGRAPTALHAGGHTLTFARDAAGREVERRLDQQVRLGQTWDGNHRLRSQALSRTWGRRAAGGQARLLRRRSYRYRADGYLTGLADQHAGGYDFQLDPAGRVTAVRGPAGNEDYTYDPAGNLTHAEWPARTPHEARGGRGAREYDGTLVRRAGEIHYRYDAAGRVVAREQPGPATEPDTWGYHWDDADRLRAVTTPEGQVWRYCYDPLGRRVAKQRLGPDGATVVDRTTFVWDGPVLAEQTTGADPDRWHTTVWEWEPGTCRPVAQRERSAPAASQDAEDRQFYAVVTDSSAPRTNWWLRTAR